MPAQKRRLGKTSQGNPLPTKRSRPRRACTQQPRVQDERAHQATKTTTRNEPEPNPNPNPPTRPRLRVKTDEPERTSPATLLPEPQIGSDRDDNKGQLKWVPLTRGNLSLFNKIEKNEAGSGATESTDDSSSTGTTPTMPDLPNKARENGMLDPTRSKPPTNLQSILQRHEKNRATPPPTQSMYESYAERARDAPNEATMANVFMRHILKTPVPGYDQVLDREFTGFPKNVGFNNGLPAPKPDYVEGLKLAEFMPIPADEHVEGAVLHKDGNSLVLPHLAGEFKRRGGDLEVAEMQSGYNGAALVHARNQALSRLGRPDPPGHAEVESWATDGNRVRSYAHYSTPAEDGKVEYHQWQFASENVRRNYEGHKAVWRGIRNAQDHAREQSYEMRDQLKEHWKQQQQQQQRDNGPDPKELLCM